MRGLPPKIGLHTRLDGSHQVRASRPGWRPKEGRDLGHRPWERGSAGSEIEREPKTPTPPKEGGMGHPGTFVRAFKREMESGIQPLSTARETDGGFGWI